MKELVSDILCNDKNLVIFAVLIIVVYAMYSFGQEAKEIATNALSGLFGIAVGTRLNQDVK